jgi:hypothetical protein
MGIVMLICLAIIAICLLKAVSRLFNAVVHKLEKGK